MIILNDIPGAIECLERQNSVRESAFLHLCETICGIDVNQFTLRHLQILSAIGSPFVENTGTPTGVDVAQFLWVVSPAFTAGDTILERWKRKRFIKRCRKLPYVEAVERIQSYLSDAFLDMPKPAKKSGPRKPPTASFTGAVVHQIASAYGWTPDVIENLPMTALWQWIKLFDGIDENPTDAFIDAEIERRNKLAEQQKTTA